MGLLSCGLFVSFEDYATGTFAVRGSVTGLNGAHVTLVLGAARLGVGDGPFAFAPILGDGARYNVHLEADPPGHSCLVVNGTGTIAGADATGVIVECGPTDAGSTPKPSDAGATDAQDASLGDAAVDAADAAERPDCSADPTLEDATAGFSCVLAPPGSETCANDQTCCDPSNKDGLGHPFSSFCAAGKNGDSTCNSEGLALGSSYEGGSAWECADNNACGAVGVCCLIQDPARLALDPKNTLAIANTTATDPKHPPGCGTKRSYNEGGSRCRASCAAGEIGLCSLSDSSCGVGMSCRPFFGFGRALGYCQ